MTSGPGRRQRLTDRLLVLRHREQQHRHPDMGQLPRRRAGGRHREHRGAEQRGEVVLAPGPARGGHLELGLAGERRGEGIGQRVAGPGSLPPARTTTRERLGSSTAGGRRNSSRSKREPGPLKEGGGVRSAIVARPTRSQVRVDHHVGDVGRLGSDSTVVVDHGHWGRPATATEGPRANRYPSRTTQSTAGSEARSTSRLRPPSSTSGPSITSAPVASRRDRNHDDGVSTMAVTAPPVATHRSARAAWRMAWPAPMPGRVSARISRPGGRRGGVMTAAREGDRPPGAGGPQAAELAAAESPWRMPSQIRSTAVVGAGRQVGAGRRR